MFRLFLALISFINLVLFLEPNIALEGKFLSYAPLFSILSAIVYILKGLVASQREFRIFYIVLIGILYFNTPMYFTYLLDENEGRYLVLKHGIDFIYFIKTNYLLGTSIPLLILGYELKQKRVSHPIIIEKREIVSTKYLFICSTILLAYNVIKLGITFGGLFTSQNVDVFYILLIRSVSLTSCALFYNYRIENGKRNISFLKYSAKNITTITLLVFFIAYSTIGGDRGPAATIIIMLAIGYLSTREMIIKTSELFISIFACIILFNVFFAIEDLRATNYGESFSTETLMNYSSEDSEMTSLGSSQKCTALAIQGIDDGIYPHSYGLFFLGGLLKSIPYIGNKIFEIIGIPSIIGEGSARLLTIQFYGEDSVTGLGTTYLAELYIEFGVFGIIIISILFGYLSRFLDKEINNKNITFETYVLIMFFAGYAFYLGRGTLHTFLINYIHTLIFYYIIYKIPKFIFSKHV